MTDTPDANGLPPSLRFLRGLVITLMITMIVGVITVVGLLVTRMPDASTAPVPPAQITLPDGSVPEAVTYGKGWIAVVTTDHRFLVFTTDGTLRQEVLLQIGDAP